LVPLNLLVSLPDIRIQNVREIGWEGERGGSPNSRTCENEVWLQKNGGLLFQHFVAKVVISDDLWQFRGFHLSRSSLWCNVFFLQRKSRHPHCPFDYLLKPPGCWLTDPLESKWTNWPTNLMWLKQ
jgi:hypothetical protein